MGGRLVAGMVALLAALAAAPASAGGWGGHGFAFHPAGGRPALGGVQGPSGGVRPGFSGFRPGGARWGGLRRLPPISGVIHERAGLRPYYSPYGHTNTAAFSSRYGWSRGAYGHLGTRYGRARFRHFMFVGGWGPGVYGFGRRIRGGYGRVFAGGGYDGGGYYDGGYDGGGYPGPAGDGRSDGYDGHVDTQGRALPNRGYLSETPLSVTRTESPLAPSPFGGDGGSDVAYGVGPRIITVRHASRAGCDCGVRPTAMPVIYRYGVGTAY